MIDSWLPSTLIFKAFRGWIKAWFLFFGGFVSGVQFNRLHPHTFAIYEQVYRSSLTFEQTHNGAVFFKRHLTWGSCVRSNLECDNVTSSMIRTGMHYSTQCVKKESWKKTIEVRIVLIIDLHMFNVFLIPWSSIESSFWARVKTLMTFHHTDGFIGILMMEIRVGSTIPYLP